MQLDPRTLARLHQAWLTLAVALAVCVGAGAARAQSNDYKALTEAGVEEHSLGHYEEARALFARAHAINPNARTFWGMGIAAFEARQYVDAIQLLKQARDDARKPLTPAQRKQTDSLLERSEAFVVRVPLRVQPASAKVSVDGRDAAPDADGQLLLDAGTHQVVVTAQGYEDFVRSMRWSAGTAAPLDVRLDKKRAAEPERSEAPPPAAAAAAAAVAAPAAAPGTSSLTVLKWVSLGASVASLGVMGAGIALHETGAAKYNDESQCAPPDKDVSCPGQREEVNRWRTMAIVSGAAAGVFATLSVVFFALDRPSRDQAQARVQCGPAFAAGAICQLQF